MEDPRQILVKCGDDIDVPVMIDIAKMSTLLSEMIEDLGEERGNIIPLPNVQSSIFVKIIEYCSHHLNDPVESAVQALINDNKVSTWDEEFCEQMEVVTIIEIMLAANFLDVQPLFRFCCQTLAQKIHGKTPEEIRATFNIKKKFTIEDEMRVIAENPWLQVAEVKKRQLGFPKSR